MRFIDLFAGLGGFHLALSRLGHECVFASEIDAELREVYEQNFGLVPAGDLKKVSVRDIPAHDVLCAGFPCQPFSKAGAQRGFECPTSGDLFFEILRVLGAKFPGYFILENVGNLTRHDGGKTWREMLSALRDLGYAVDYASRSPSDIGTAHDRQRVFIVGVRQGVPVVQWPSRSATSAVDFALDECPDDAIPLSVDKISLLNVWQEFLDRYPAEDEFPSFPVWSAEFGASYPYETATPWSVGDGALRHFRGAHGQQLSELEGEDVQKALPPYARRHETLFPDWKIRFIRQNRQLYSRHRGWIDAWIPSVRQLPPSHQKLEWNCKGGERDLWKYLIQFRASGIRVRHPTSAPTLVAMNSTQVPVVAWQRRYMTHRECARLQGMHELRVLPRRPENAFKALGNAVNADLVESIARSLLETPVEPIAKAKRPFDARYRLARPTTPKPKAAMTAPTKDRVNIRPPVNVLSVLRHLNYQPWYALAEFVDNAVQSFLANRKEIQGVDGRSAKLKVWIIIDPEDDGRIVIRDNAGGIHKRDYTRAFRAAEVPPDRTGLSEFGMGMKSAACWFAPVWTVRTSAVGEPVERTVTFDIHSIVKDSIEELDIEAKRASANSHFTEIILSQVYKVPQKRTLGKIKDHLSSMYRIYIRDGVLELYLNNEPLSHQLPAVLSTPFFKTPTAKSVVWQKDIDIDLGGRRRIKGFAALREKGSTIDSGFALFRRKRAIQGTGDQGYRPEAIFGRSNSYVYQRLFGELHLEGFDVSHTKDGIRWDEYEDEFLEQLHEQLDAKPLPLLQQAVGYRAKPSKEEVRGAAERAIDRAAEAIAEHVADTFETLDVLEPEIQPPETFSHARRKDLVTRTIEIERHGTLWEIILEACYEESMGDWIEVIAKDGERGKRRLGVRVAVMHPFTQRFAGADPDALEPLVRIAAALGLAETTAREVGVKKAGTVRVHFNELIRETLARE